jgi:hypothetical protein
MKLSLERVCFPHLDWDRFNHQNVPQSPTPEIPAVNHGAGHVYSATTNLMNHRSSKDPTIEPFQCPKPDIDKLFQSSLHVNFGTEVTPLQVWANLIRISKLGFNVCPDVVEKILAHLKERVKCRG